MGTGEAGGGGATAGPPRPAVLNRLGHVPAFDGVRAVAVALVVWFHVGLLRVFPNGWKPSGGFLGVDAFFVLSGFLITALLLGEQARRGGSPRFRSFYRRRAMRLLPVIVLFIGAYIVFASIHQLSSAHVKSSILAVAFYYTNWKAIWAPPLSLGIGHLWSLAVEEQFYIVWPLVVAVVSVRMKLRSVVMILGSAIVAIAVHRAVMYQHGVALTRLLVGTDTRADTLLVGALLAHLWVRGRVPRRGVVAAAWIALAFFALCVARCTYATSALYLGGYTLLAIAVAIMILAVLETDWSGARPLRLRPVRAVGRVSYGIYVWHPLVFLWVFFYTADWNAGVRLVVAFATLATVTFASWTFVERPFLRWKDRLTRSARAGKTVSPTTGTRSSPTLATHAAPSAT